MEWKGMEPPSNSDKEAAASGNCQKAYLAITFQKYALYHRDHLPSLSTE
jgi:hypothetical protein